jgi:hypothetical protein
MSDMCEQRRVRRRQYVAGLATVISCGVAGCTGASEVEADAPSVDTDEGAPCANAFRIAEESAQFREGSVPEIRLRLRNSANGPIEYELDVSFEQATSTGLYTKSGGDTLSGTLAAGTSAVVTASTDGRDAQHADRYDVDMSLVCPSA